MPILHSFLPFAVHFVRRGRIWTLNAILRRFLPFDLQIRMLPHIRVSDTRRDPQDKANSNFTTRLRARHAQSLKMCVRHAQSLQMVAEANSHLNMRLCVRHA